MKCAGKGCTPCHLKNLCRMYVLCSSSLIYLGVTRKRWGRHDIFKIPDTYTKQSIFLILPLVAVSGLLSEHQA